MPLVCDKITLGGRLLVWEISESEEELAGVCSQYDVVDSKNISAVSRRLQRLAARAALRIALPDATVSYNDIGAPYIGQTYISISHCDGYAAVMLSDAPCGVDIENAGRDFGRVAERFVSGEEKNLPAKDSAIFLPLIWCAKEALYKFSGRKELNLKRDIGIISVDIVQGRISGRLPDNSRIELAFLRYRDIIIVHTI